MKADHVSKPMTWNRPYDEVRLCQSTLGWNKRHAD